ncbi:hypothetical protein ACIBK8_25740 [Streptomyces sp. NPDC050161]|uniref:hypothetical protein n=1 Tax=Streptomyces sp. NPDC050161 TaxID=3365604 RepID=UPI0037A7AE31
MDPGTHFVFGTHPQHGFVASFTSHMPPHLADWFLVREQFEPVPDRPHLFRLTEPERDGPRRALQAARDLRHLGYIAHVDADVALAPVTSPAPPRAVRPDGSPEQRSRIAQAAGRSSPRRSTPPTPVPAVQPVPPMPSGPSTVRLSGSPAGRSR